MVSAGEMPDGADARATDGRKDEGGQFAVVVVARYACQHFHGLLVAEPLEMVNAEAPVEGRRLARNALKQALSGGQKIDERILLHVSAKGLLSLVAQSAKQIAQVFGPVQLKTVFLD